MYIYTGRSLKIHTKGVYTGMYGAGGSCAWVSGSKTPVCILHFMCFDIYIPFFKYIGRGCEVVYMKPAACYMFLRLRLTTGPRARQRNTKTKSSPPTNRAPDHTMRKTRRTQHTTQDPIPHQGFPRFVIEDLLFAQRSRAFVWLNFFWINSRVSSRYFVGKIKVDSADRFLLNSSLNFGVLL